MGRTVVKIFCLAASFCFYHVAYGFQLLTLPRPPHPICSPCSSPFGSPSSSPFSSPRQARTTTSALFFTKRRAPWLCPVEPTDSIEDLEKSATDGYIDSIVDQVTGYTGGPIMLEYKPDRQWLWSRWQGTLLQHGMKKAVRNMLVATFISLVLNRLTGGVGAFSRETSNGLVLDLKVFDKLWHYCQTLTTFILTFFVTQAYGFWRNMYSLGRKIQGRINDINILCATHAKRDATGKYTKESEAVLNDVGAYLRLLSPLMWASQSRRLRVLLTNRGLYRLVERGFVPRKHVDTLLQLDLPRKQIHNACLEWALIRIIKAQKEGVFHSSEGFDHIILQKVCDLRAHYGSIPDETAGRMPLVYAHFVQVLLDFFLFGAPFALYTELGSMSIACVGLFTLFYEGLFDLSKVFLDPLENEDYCDGGIEMDLAVLIRESNSGSIRWKNGAAILPFEATPSSSLDLHSQRI